MLLDRVSSERVLKEIDFGESLLLGISVTNKWLILRINGDLSGVTHEAFASAFFAPILIGFQHPMKMAIEYELGAVPTALDFADAMDLDLGGFSHVTIHDSMSGHHVNRFEAVFHYGKLDVSFNNVAISSGCRDQENSWLFD